MKNKKGFTLIELLAVIVVLAIIALITIPQVLGMTDKAKESANLRSVEGHIENMNNSIASLVFESGVRDGIYTFDEFNFSTFPKKDHIRCEKYEVKKSTIVKAVNCLINDKKYCYELTYQICYLWIKITKLSFIRTSNIRYIIRCVEIILNRGQIKIASMLIGLIGGNKNLYEWNIRGVTRI